MQSKWVSPHLKNHPANQKAQKPQNEGNPAMQSKVGVEHGEEQTQPHPVTGVHKVEMAHHGGGKFKSKTHHSGGQVEEQEHQGEQAANQHMQDSFPSNENEDSQNEQMSDDGSGMDDMPLSALGE